MSDTKFHVLAKAVDTYTVECPGQPDCNGLIECQEKHVIDGVNADIEGPDDCDEGVPWCGLEQFEFHDVTHTWNWSGWTVPYTGCVVRDHPCTPNEASDLLRGKPSGRYLVRDNWDEDEFTLELVGIEDGEPR